MEEDEILDALDITQPNKSILKAVIFATIFLVGFLFILRLNVIQHNINSVMGAKSKSILIILILHVGAFIFIHNINYQKPPLYKIILFNSIILFIGIQGRSIISDISKKAFSLSYYLSLPLLRDFMIGCIVFSTLLSSGIYHWLKNKNRWLLPLLVILFISLAFLMDYSNPDNHDW